MMSEIKVVVSLHPLHWQAVRKLVNVVCLARGKDWVEWGDYVQHTIQSALDQVGSEASVASLPVSFPRTHWENLQAVISEGCANRDAEWRAWNKAIQRTISAAIANVPITRFIFYNMWYLPLERVAGDGKLIAWDDTGVLAVDANGLTFQGTTSRLAVSKEAVRFICIGRQGRDFINKWVKIIYVEGEQVNRAYFADGSGLGWGGLLNGTQKILDTLHKFGYSISPVDRDLAIVVSEVETKEAKHQD